MAVSSSAGSGLCFDLLETGCQFLLDGRQFCPCKEKLFAPKLKKAAKLTGSLAKLATFSVGCLGPDDWVDGSHRRCNQVRRRTFLDKIGRLGAGRPHPIRGDGRGLTIRSL